MASVRINARNFFMVSQSPLFMLPQSRAVFSEFPREEAPPAGTCLTLSRSLPLVNRFSCKNEYLFAPVGGVLYFIRFNPEKQPKICEYFQHRYYVQMNKRVNIQIRLQEGGRPLSGLPARRPDSLFQHRVPESAISAARKKSPGRAGTQGRPWGLPSLKDITQFRHIQAHWTSETNSFPCSSRSASLPKRLPWARSISAILWKEPPQRKSPPGATSPKVLYTGRAPRC